MQNRNNIIIKYFIALLLTALICISGVCNIYGDDYPTSPEGVVGQYVKLDYAGKGLTGVGYREMLTYTNWIDGPAWDTVIVVKEYSIGKSTISSDMAFVPVKYEALGSIDGYEWKDIKSNKFTPDDRKEIHPRFVLVKSANKWVIEAPQNRPHVSVEVIRDHIRHLLKDSSHRHEERKDLENTMKVLNNLLKVK